MTFGKDSTNAERTSEMTELLINGELEKQGHKLTAMREWCGKTEISFTLTFFVDGHQLPELYTVDDLKYFLKT